MAYRYSMEPEVSVIIPSLDGNRLGNVSKLIDSLKNQSFKNLEIVLVIGEKPNGHSRNVGFPKCSGASRYLAFFDDDIEILDSTIIAKFIEALQHKEFGLVGASQLPPKGSSLLQKWISYDLAKASVREQSEYLDSEMVTHAGMACRREVWVSYDGEDSNLVTGTDTDLRERLRAGGLRVVLVPHTTVYHPLPNSVKAILKAAMRNGWHQYDYRLKHGFQTKIMSIFIKPSFPYASTFIMLRELLIFFPHIFYSNRHVRIGFRPINAVFRLFMAYGYVKRLQAEKKNV
ncbi:glycosyltransferase [Amylibacter sp.]|nr:glycosyltransferase [Amylibacter sp.]